MAEWNACYCCGYYPILWIRTYKITIYQSVCPKIRSVQFLFKTDHFYGHNHIPLSHMSTSLTKLDYLYIRYKLSQVVKTLVLVHIILLLKLLLILLNSFE